MNDIDAPYGRTGNGRPIPGSFTGTVPAFLDWLQDNLAYGGVRIDEPTPDEFREDRMIRRVHLVTGGYSDDESLLGRVGRSMFSLRFWESDHRGGLSIYHVPVKDFESEQEITWLNAPTDTFETVARARTLRVITAQGDELSFYVPYGVELDFSEPDRDICEPAGEITVRAIAEEDSPWASPSAPDSGSTPNEISDEELTRILDEITRGTDAQ